MAVTVERLIAEIDADPAKAEAALAQFSAASSAAAKDETKNIWVRIHDDDMNRLENSFGSVTRGAGRASVSIDTLGGSFRTSSRAALILKGALVGIVVGTVYTFITNLAGALSALTGVVAGLSSAIGPLGGLLFSLVPALGAVAGGLGAALLGFSGVSAGVKALGQVTGGAGGATVNYARKQRELASAMRGVREASRSLKKAQEELAKAQRELADAPRRAREALQQQSRDTKQALLDERRAVIDLEAAQRRLSDAQNSAANTAFKFKQEVDEFTGKTYDVADAGNDAADASNKQEQALLDLEQAELDVANARQRSKDEQRKLTDMEKKGIKNSDIVVEAQERVHNAQMAVAAAYDSLAAAKERVADIKDGSAAGAAGANAWNEAMQNLSATGQRFVRFLHGEFLPATKQLRFAAQDGLLPGVERGLRAIMGRFEGLSVVVKAFATTMGDGFAELALFWTQSDRSRQLYRTFMGLDRVLQGFIRTLTPASRIMVSLAEAATDLTNNMSKGLFNQLDRLANWMESTEGKNTMADYFEEVWTWTKRWGSVLGPLTGVLRNVIKAAKPLATWMLETMADYFEDLNDRTREGTKGFREMTDFFDRQRPTIREFTGLFKDLAKVLFTSGQGGEESAFVRTAQKFREVGIPALQGLIDALDRSNFGPNFAEFTANLIDFFAVLVENDGPLTLIVQGINNLADGFRALSDATDGRSTKLAIDFLTALAAFKIARGIGNKIKGAAGGIAAGAGALSGGAHKGERGGSGAGAVVVGGAGGERAKGGAHKAKPGVGASMGKGAAVGAAAAVTWAAVVGSSADEGSAKMKVAEAVITGAYIAMAAQALIQAGRMALAWVIAMGPIGWVTAAIVALGVLIYMNWEKIKQWTSAAWSAIVNFVKNNWQNLVLFLLGPIGIGILVAKFLAKWDALREGVRKVIEWVYDKFKWLVEKLTGFKMPSFDSVWSGLKSSFKSAINWVIDKWNSFAGKIPSVNIPGVGKISVPKIDRLYTGGPVEKGKPYIVGENRPELFVPTTSGRIMPNLNNIEGGGGGISDAQLERILNKVMKEAKPDVKVEQTFNEKVDPKHMSEALAWKIAS